MAMIDSSVVYTCIVPTTNNMSMKNNVPGPLLGLEQLYSLATSSSSSSSNIYCVLVSHTGTSIQYVDDHTVQYIL